jgi:FkbM family methyltransferase
MNIKDKIKIILYKFGLNLTNIKNLDILPGCIYKHMSPDFFFIQIGANDGKRFDPIHNIVKAYNLSGLAIEPIKEYYDELKHNYTGTRVITVNKAIYSNNEKITLNKVVNNNSLPEWSKGIASIDPLHHERAGIDKKYIVQEIVEAITFVNLLETYNVKHVDLLLIDTEGYDKHIIEMIPFDKISPKIIQFEHNLSAGSMTSEELTDILAKFMKMNYKVCVNETDCIAYL